MVLLKFEKKNLVKSLTPNISCQVFKDKLMCLVALFHRVALKLSIFFYALPTTHFLLLFFLIHTHEFLSRTSS